MAGSYPFTETTTGGKNAQSEEGGKDPRASIAIARLNFLHSHYPIASRTFCYSWVTESYIIVIRKTMTTFLRYLWPFWNRPWVSHNASSLSMHKID